MDEKTLKGGGFIKLRGPDQWAVRLKILLGDTTAEQLRAIAKLAEDFGDGTVHLTVRQGLEVRGVRLADFDAIMAALAEAGLGTGACGARVRVPVACPGSATCKRGLNDTGRLARELDRRLYGRADLPHKFKAAVTGCRASCAKPQANDVGYMGAIEPAFDAAECIACGVCASRCEVGAISLDSDGYPVLDLSACTQCGECVSACPTGSMVAGREGWRVFLGGKFGREPALAYQVASLVDDEEALAIAERALEAFVRFGEGRERMRDTIDRVGLDVFLGEVVPA